MKRKILAVTGIRSEYEALSYVFKEIEHHPKLKLELIVTGAHLSDAYGLTREDISRDGFKVADEVLNLINSDSLGSRVKGLAIQLSGMVQTVERVKPDILLVLGDREEVITTSLVGAYTNIPVAHISGGDRVVGNVDDHIRHSATRLAHIHLTTNEESAERIRKFGEQHFRIFNTGSPGLDKFVKSPEMSYSQLSKKLKIQLKSREPFIILIQHSLSSEVQKAYRQMKTTLEALKQLGIKTLISYPNSDPGGQAIIRVIEEFKQFPFLETFKNIPRVEFVNLMRKAKCLVGNSSCGIFEAPFLKLPVVNVGNRQKHRLHAENVQFATHSRQAISAAIKKALFDKKYLKQVAECSNPYGDGRASEKIAHILATIPIDQKLLIKDLTY